MIRNSITSYTVNHQYSVPTIYQRVSRTHISGKSFDLLFFNFRRHAKEAQRPYHLHNNEHSRMARMTHLLHCQTICK